MSSTTKSEPDDVGGVVWPSQIRLVDVGLRDGLQAVPTTVATDDKVLLVEGLIDAGFRELEVASFARPDLIPQVADAEDLCARLPREAGVTYRGLIPNLRGARRAADCGLDTWVVVVAADDEVSLRNQGRTTDAVLEDLPAIGELSEKYDADLVVAVACAFFAPASGPTPPARVDRILQAAVVAGAAGAYLAGTTGVEHPGEFLAGVARAKQSFPQLQIGVHLHNRNGFGSANAVAAMAAGADWIEAAFCGYGGDPWFPGDPATVGNYPMEDLVHLCDSMGIATGVDLERYREVARLAERVAGVRATSFVQRAGSRADLAAFVWPESSRW